MTADWSDRYKSKMKRVLQRLSFLYKRRTGVVVFISAVLLSPRSNERGQVLPSFEIRAAKVQDSTKPSLLYLSSFTKILATEDENQVSLSFEIRAAKVQDSTEPSLLYLSGITKRSF